MQTLTVAQGTDDIQTQADVSADYEATRRIGHSGAIQRPRGSLRTWRPDGTLYKKGTAIPHRADFNTLDNPFFWTAHPDRDRFVREPAAGLHFVVFNPSSDDFRRNRLAMDGILPDGTVLPFEPRSPRPGLQRRAPDDASPELPRAAAGAPLFPLAELRV